MKKRGKKGALEISFGMIISIILIIVFITFAFYAIKKVLDWQKSLQVAKFVDELKISVNSVWKSNVDTSSSQFSGIVPSSIEKICFIDADSSERGVNKRIAQDFSLSFNDGKNMFFYPETSTGLLNPVKIDNLNIIKITKTENPYCIDNEDGKASMILKKEKGDVLVVIQRG